jgi:putative ABC transport system permease protein
MNIFLKLTKESIIIAFQEITNNKLRAFLSLLGITIGIFCIISVFTAVDSLEKNVKTSFQKLGDNVVYVQKPTMG